MRITYQRLDHTNFSIASLDDFIRHQSVQECWRYVQGEWRLVPVAYEENWSREQCRGVASDIKAHIGRDQTALGAFDGSRLVGFAAVSHELFGAKARYVELVCFQVSEPYRKNGIGRALFSMACEEARGLGADKLYISGHSSKESQAAYRALGCVNAREINQRIAQSEPYDVQLEYALD